MAAKRALQKKRNNAISHIATDPPVDSVQDAQGQPEGMIRAKDIEPFGLDNHIQENFLTYDEVFTLVDEYATIPYNGEYEDRWTVKALQEAFQGTKYASLFDAMPKGTSLSAAELYEHVSSGDHHQEKPLRVGVENGLVEYGIDDGEPPETDGVYHMDWQQRASFYRLRTLDIVPDLSITDLEELQIDFHSHMPPNQFELTQGRFDKLPNVLPPKGGGGLPYLVYQARLFESKSQGIWKERPPLIFLSVSDPHSSTKEIGTRENGTVLKASVFPFPESHALLKRPVIPTEFFTPNHPTNTPKTEIRFAIEVPLPTDLKIPRKNKG